MNTEENEILEMLKAFPDRYVSVGDVSRRLGSNQRYAKNRDWAAPILRRLEIDGLVEMNSYGEYRFKPPPPVLFKSGIDQPGVSLGETTIIRLDQSKEKK
jgi:hypothetical protein